MMNISNGYIINTVCFNFIYNTNELSIINTKILQSMDGKYNPNNLHSNAIISQDGSESVLYIYNSYFIGSYYGISSTLGSVEIINCTLQQMAIAIDILYADKFILQYSEIKNNGRYNGPFQEEVEGDYTNFPIKFDYNDIIIVENNIFYGFDPNGFIISLFGSAFLFQNNIIMVDTSGIYYNIPDDMEIYFEYAPLYYMATSDTSTINNKFEFKYDDINIQLLYGWIYYFSGGDFNCLSGRHL